jgi:hypothetical protein
MRTGYNSIWTDDRMQLLRRLHATLKGTRGWRAIIAARLGVSELALTAKLGREYAAHRMTPNLRMPRRSPSAKRAAHAVDHGDHGDHGDNADRGPHEIEVRLVELHQVRQAVASSAPIAPARTCQWPLWSDSQARPLRVDQLRFCDARAVPGASWCEDHCTACWGPDWRNWRARMFAARSVRWLRVGVW